MTKLDIGKDRALYHDVNASSVERWFAAERLFPELAERIALTQLKDGERPEEYEERLSHRTGKAPEVGALQNPRALAIAADHPPRDGELHDEWELRLNKMATVLEHAGNKHRRTLALTTASRAARQAAARALLPDELRVYADDEGSRIGPGEGMSEYTARLRSAQKADFARQAAAEEFFGTLPVASSPALPWWDEGPLPTLNVDPFAALEHQHH